jgi:hypothetical protein
MGRAITAKHLATRDRRENQRPGIRVENKEERQSSVLVRQSSAGWVGDLFSAFALPELSSPPMIEHKLCLGVPSAGAQSLLSMPSFTNLSRRQLEWDQPHR